MSIIKLELNIINEIKLKLNIIKLELDIINIIKLKVPITPG